MRLCEEHVFFTLKYRHKLLSRDYVLDARNKIYIFDTKQDYSGS